MISLNESSGGAAPGAGVETASPRMNAGAVEAMEVERRQQRQRWSLQPRPINVGPDERAVSVLSGALLGAFGLSRRTLPGLVLAGIGGVLAYRGITGHCHTYQALGIDTSKAHAIHVDRAYIINRTAGDLYAFWRDFSNLPRIMPHLEWVDVQDDRHSHWTARLVGCSLRWDAEVTADEPNRLIAWRSVPGGDLQTRGEIQFTPALGDRGTNVQIVLDYIPPAGKLGHWIATVMGQSPERVLREELCNFKRLMEVGELPTINGQPRGRCTGKGRQYTDKD